MPGPFGYGVASNAQLVTTRPPLQLLFNKAIQVTNLSIVQGKRTVDQQIVNIRNEASKTLDSRHIPRDAAGIYDPDGLGGAIDFKPYQKGVNAYPLESDSKAERMKKKARFYHAQGVILGIANEMGIDIRQGVDWDGDGDFMDQTFDDLGHVEMLIAFPKLVVTGVFLEQANEALLARGLPAYA